MSGGQFPWRTLLFVSVAVNLLVIGVVAGAIGAGARLQREDPEAVVVRMPGVRTFLASVPADVRAAMRTELASSWRESREARQAARQARVDAFNAVAAEPYDAERVREAFARMRAADQSAIGVFHDNVADALAALTPEQRRQTLEALRNAAPARPAQLAPAGEGADGAEAPAQQRPALSPEQRENLREEFRERRRERLEDMRRQRQQ